jgi:uncharacterized surface protein with fasciclin (FAS1) repeats
MEKYTAYDYLVANEDKFSSFIQIVKAADLQGALSSYNPNGADYTLFAPSNDAVDDFIKNNSQYSSLNDLLKDKSYVSTLARYHVVNMGVKTTGFPYGAFTEATLSDDYLNVNYIIETDTTYFKINNQAPVVQTNIEVSNGYVHVIGVMLTPVTQNSYGWLKSNAGYSIFLSAIEATGIDKIINVDMKSEDQKLSPFTVLVEPDYIYKKRKINSFEDLAKSISPNRTDYTSTTNPLYSFVGYHILTQSLYLNDFTSQTEATNYGTFADIPIRINGTGLDILINRGKENFDTIVVNGVTTIIDYVGLNYDASNVVTQSGAIHFIDQVLKPQVASRAFVSFSFWDQPTKAMIDYQIKGGTYLIDDPKTINNVTWSGSELYYVKSFDDSERAYNKDYLKIDGDFTISYVLPKIIQGKYNVILRAHAFSSANAVVELSIDGNKLGGLINLQSGGNAGNPYVDFNIGAVDFKKYDSHTVKIEPLIPGTFIWDLIRFEPI